MTRYAWIVAVAGTGTMLAGNAAAATLVTSSNYQLLVGSHAVAETSKIEQGNESKGIGSPQKLTGKVDYSTYATATSTLPQGKATAYASNYTSLTPGGGDDWTVRMADDTYAALTKVTGRAVAYNYRYVAVMGEISQSALLDISYLTPAFSWLDWVEVSGQSSTGYGYLYQGTMTGFRALAAADRVLGQGQFLVAFSNGGSGSAASNESRINNPSSSMHFTYDRSLRVALTSYTPTAAVPEPASWAMMILGFGVVGAALRQRRMTAQIRSPA